jgi:hypothetical protein
MGTCDLACSALAFAMDLYERGILLIEPIKGELFGQVS